MNYTKEIVNANIQPFNILLLLFYLTFTNSKPQSLKQGDIHSFELQNNQGKIFSVDYFINYKTIFIHLSSFVGNAILYEMKGDYSGYDKESTINNTDLILGLTNNTLFEVLGQDKNYILEYEVLDLFKNGSFYILSFCLTDNCEFDIFWYSLGTPVNWTAKKEIIDEISGESSDKIAKQYSIDLLQKGKYLNIEINVILGSANLKVVLPRDDDTEEEISENGDNYVYAYNSIYFSYYASVSTTAKITILKDIFSVAMYSIIYYFSDLPWEREEIIYPGKTFTTFLIKNKPKTFKWNFDNGNIHDSSAYSLTIGSDNCKLTSDKPYFNKKDYYYFYYDHINPESKSSKMTINGSDILSETDHITCSMYIYITSSRTEDSLLIIENLRTPIYLQSNTTKEMTLFFPIYYTSIDTGLIIDIELLLNKPFIIDARFNNQPSNSNWVQLITHSQSLAFSSEIKKFCSFSKLCYLILTVSLPKHPLEDISKAFFTVQMTDTTLHWKYLQKNKVYSTWMQSNYVYNHYYTDVKYGETGVVSLNTEQNDLKISAIVSQKNVRIKAFDLFYNSHIGWPMFNGNLKIFRDESVWRYNITDEKCKDYGCELFIGLMINSFKSYDICLEYNLFIKKDNDPVEIYEHIFIQDEFSHDEKEFVYFLNFTANYDAFILTIEGNVNAYKISESSSAFDFNENYVNTGYIESLQLQFNKKDTAVSLEHKVITISILNDPDNRYYGNFLLRVTPLYDRNYNVIEVNSEKVEYCHPDNNNSCYYLRKYRSGNEPFSVSIHSYYPNKSLQNITISSVFLQDKMFTSIKKHIDKNEYTFTNNKNYTIAIWNINKCAIDQNNPFSAYILTKIQADSSEHIFPVYISFSWVDDLYTLKPNTNVMLKIPNGSEVTFALRTIEIGDSETESLSDFKMYTTITKVFGSGKLKTYNSWSNFSKRIDNLIISNHKYIREENNEFALIAEEEGWVVLISTQNRNITQYKNIKEILFSRRNEIMYSSYSFPMMLYMKIPNDIDNYFTINFKIVQKYLSIMKEFMHWNAFNITASFVDYNCIHNYVYNANEDVWPKVPLDSFVLELEKLIIFKSNSETWINDKDKYNYVWIEIQTTENFVPDFLNATDNNAGFQIISYPNANAVSSFPQWKYFYSYLNIFSLKMNFILTKNKFMDSLFSIEFANCTNSLIDVDFDVDPESISHTTLFGKEKYKITEETSRRNIVMTIQLNELFMSNSFSELYFMIKYSTMEPDEEIYYNKTDDSFIPNYNDQNNITVQWSGIKEISGKYLDISANYYFRVYNQTTDDLESICMIRETPYRYNTNNKTWQLYYNKPKDIDELNLVGTLVGFFQESSDEEVMIAYKPKEFRYVILYYIFWFLVMFLYIWGFVGYLLYSFLSILTNNKKNKKNETTIPNESTKEILLFDDSSIWSE